MKSLFKLCLCMFAGLACSCGTAEDGDAFVRVENGRFVLDGKPCYFLGTNFWYGPILGSKGPGGDRERLARELDTLAACGVTNLRVLVGADGGGGVPSKIEPTLQYVPGKYNDELLDGLDYFLAELGRRGMKAVLYLTNSWEWSGGYSQYLAWTGAGKPAIPAVDGYEAYVEYVSHFIPSREARALLEEHVRFIVGRTNRYTGLRYADDPAIFSWQICNEPRPFGEQNKEAFAEWIARTARLIRSLDANHMISTGSEGFYGCEADMELVERIHAVPEISYVNLHIWPYNWNWTPRKDPASGLRNSMEETRRYIDRHL
nr:beta-galactosidase [Alistipes sp. Marseille-P5061]